VGLGSSFKMNTMSVVYSHPPSHNIGNVWELNNDRMALH